MSVGLIITTALAVVDVELNRGIWRPPQWQNPATILLTFPGQGTNTPQYSSASGIGATLPTGLTNYVFDAVIRAAHEQELRRTEHPVQTGASISDHAYIMPARLILDVGMSDAMDAFFNPSTWAGDPSKSVSCFQTLLALQFSRIPLQITTRLRTYKNMLIDSITPEETVKTVAGLRMRVEFGQIFMAQISIQPNSARPQDTGATNLGSVTPQPPSASQQQQNITPPAYHPWDSIGAGDASSVNQNNLTSLPSK